MLENGTHLWFWTVFLFDLGFWIPYHHFCYSLPCYSPPPPCLLGAKSLSMETKIVLEISNWALAL